MPKDPFAPSKFRIIYDKKTNRTFKIPLFPPAPPFRPKDRKKGNEYA